MPIAFGHSANLLPPVRAVTAPPNVICTAFHSYSPCSWAFSPGSKVRLRSLSKPPLFRSLIKCGSGAAVREIDETTFTDVVLKSERPVLVEFVAKWCGPCRLIAPAVESLAKEYQDKLTVVKVDHDLNPKLIEEYKVYGLPTLIVFQNGQEVSESRREGAITKVKLKEYVDKLLEAVSIV
ncbi:hypothetical protein BUALT_BualtUnG0004800 [Buddleja alternifolia]|uniref:Thioredoxin domain-containing protein n=1 Tax=Buddleja alternifolia TaxID=168488 RepID=A0AAV6W4A1_9LAMI|nr:hypothetical protein BUALT_BualtUnG0004800 [Buddleja alternifolia]